MSIASVRRTADFGALQNAAEEVAVDHRGRLLTIVDRPDAGTSGALADAAAAARASGLNVLTADASKAPSDSAFGLVRQLFARGAATATPEERTALFAGAASLAEPVLDDSRGRAACADDTPAAVMHGIYWLTGNASWQAARAGRGGLALLVDSIETADRHSISALSYLADRLKDLPVLLVAVTCNAASARARARELLEHPQGLLLSPDNTESVGHILDPGSAPAQGVAFAHLAARRARRGDLAVQTRILAERAWDGGALLEQDGMEGGAWSRVVEALAAAGFYSAAAEVAAAAANAATEIGAAATAVAATAKLSAALYRSGRLVESMSEARRALRDITNGASRGAAAAAALALIERNDFERAGNVLRRFELQSVRDVIDRATLLDAWGWLRLAQGEPVAARNDFEQAGLLFEKAGMHVTCSFWRGGLALAWHHSGDPDAALCPISTELELASMVGASALIGRALRIRGLIIGGRPGLAALEEAVDILAGSEARLEHVAALVDFGSTLRRAGMRAQARRPLHQAVDLAERVGAARLECRALDELRTSGGRARATSGLEKELLTPGERRVALLAADGHTNRQIAQQLFVTQKAVEWHLANVYRKLGIKSRQQIRGCVDQLSNRQKLAKSA